VTQPKTEYRTIAFRPGDNVQVQAGGCVQTGGSGKTWKLYVDPQGPNSDRLYHGLILLPGITGGSLVRIQGVVGKSQQVPANIDPSTAFLVLGYEDDNYGDNGYGGHDDGTGDQCKNVGAAWVTVRIDHGGGTVTTAAAPFDLVWQAVDANDMPLNPRWGGETGKGVHPDPRIVCAGFPYLDPSDSSKGVGLGSPPCTTQSPSVNPPDGFNAILCRDKAQSGHLDGHLNWLAATYAGTLTWMDHKDWTQGDDDDYNFSLTPDSQTGLTAVSTAGNPAGTIGLEFDSDETVDNIDRGWWDQFHKAVDANGGNPGGAPGGMVDNHRAIVIGLMGLDSEHGGYSELHPVYGMAILLSDSPAESTWALLARNWGDEGFCSQDGMSLPTTTLSFFLPKAGATNVNADTSELYANNNNGVAVTAQPGGALVTFDLGPSETGTLAHGQIHLSWTVPAGRGPATNAVLTERARTPAAATIERETDGPEEAVRSLVTGLPAAKQTQVLSQLKKTQEVMNSQAVKRVASVAVTRMAKPPVPRRVADPRKTALDRQRAQALCQAYNGQVPGVPAAVCAANR